MNLAAKNRVVVVEDEPILQQILKALLKSLDYEVVAVAADGYKGIEAVKAYKPDIVCLDINLPELNGLDALANIKELDGNIIAIMVTGSNDSAEVQQAIKNGADGYILKPFTASKIHSAIQKASQRKQTKNS